MTAVESGTTPASARRRLLLGLAIVAVGAGAACMRAPNATRGFILISIDTLRADHLGCYGHDRDTSPFIDSLAAGGVLFENAYAQLPGTLPSHMSIFTGLYPAEHGVYPPNGVLSAEITTLPELFAAHGFRTAGHTEGGYVHGAFGFARGFEEFNDESWKVEDDVERTLARGTAFLERLAPDDRFLLFLHTYAVHDPYPDVRSEDAQYFDFPTYLEPFWPDDPPAGSVEPTGPRLAELNRRRTMPDDEVLAYYRAAYDAQIRYVDDLLRGFFFRLEALGLADDVTVVLTSDHGEEFAEHGRLLHEQVFREALHVPLILVHPEVEPGRRVGELVQSIDIAPTLKELAGIESSWRVSGRSLVPLLSGGASGESVDAYAEGLARGERTLVRRSDDGVHQLVWWPQSLRGQGGWMSRELSFDTFGERLDVAIESFRSARSLEVEVDGEMLADVGLELPAEEGGVWISRAAALDPPGEQIRLVLQSFHRPRWIEVAFGKEPWAGVPRVRPSPAAGQQTAEPAARPGAFRVGPQPIVVELSAPPDRRAGLRLRTDGCEVPAELGLSSDRRCLGFQILNAERFARVREVASRIQVPPETRTLHLDLPAGGKKRVTLRAGSCGVPAELGVSNDPRCLSFRLSLSDSSPLDLWQVELYDNLRDPRQAVDLSAKRSDLGLPMLRALTRYRFEPAAPAQTGSLAPEHEERLRALGYLP